MPNYHYFDFMIFLVIFLFCKNIASSLLLEDSVCQNTGTCHSFIAIKSMKHHCQNRKCITCPTPLSKALQFITN